MNKNLQILFIVILFIVTGLNHEVYGQNYNLATGTVQTCAGNFYDNGGSSSNYGNNEFFVQTFCSSQPLSQIQFIFSSFNIENNSDFLTIYDGPNTFSPVIGIYTGSSGPGTVISTNSCITFAFFSDASGVAPGWASTISCISSLIPPCTTVGCPPGTTSPSNDPCSAAISLGTLPTPASCPSGLGQLVAFNGNNNCATPANPYLYQQGCQPSGNMAAPASDVWYVFNVTGNQLNVTLNGMTNPNIGLWQGAGCGSLLGRGCATGTGGTVSATFQPLTPGQYYLQVSGGSTSDQCNFNLYLQNNTNCSACVVNQTITASPAPVNGTYQAGQSVTFCYTISNYNQTSANWLHGVVPSFGPGWSTPTLTGFTAPASCSGSGTWSWYNNPVTSTATGLTVGPGFFFESSVGSPLGLADLNPGNNYGDNNPSSASCPWTFCWTVTALPPAACVQGASLGVTVTAYGDGQTGSWSPVGCNNDSPAIFNATLVCCTPPLVTSTNAACGVSNGTATGTGQGVGPFTYSWINSSGTVIQTVANTSGPNLVSGLAPGTYSFVSVTPTGCSSTATVTITQPVAFTLTPSSTNPTCNGSTNGQASISPIGGTGPYTYVWSTGQTTASISNLATGSFVVTVTDAAGCTGSSNISLTAPTAFAVNITSSTNVQCNLAANGSATAVGVGGTSPYTYVWSSGAVSASAAGLAAGSYTVTATDANGCTATTTVNISQPTIVTNTITSSAPATCNGATNGSATAAGAGGTSPYTYAWSSGAVGASAAGLAAGSYTVTATDANGCTATTTVTIAQPTVVTNAITSSAPATCNGAANGSATAAGAGGTSPYTYTWSSGAVGASAAGLAAGSYTVTATDANGCTATTSVTIAQPTFLTTSISSSTNVSCFGGTNGSATVTASGGTGPYTYLWSNGSTTSSINNLAANNYSVTVTSSNGCTSNSAAVITQPTALTASITASNNVSCTGGNNGTATVTANGGTGAYTYLWSNGNTTNNISGISAGNYTVTITTPAGCTANAAVTITQPTAVNTTITSFTNVTCFNGTNGSATANTAGGNGPYSFAWSNSAIGVTASNLAAGSYTVISTDANGCTSSAVANITAPLAVNTTISSQTNVTCFGLFNGAATAIANTGVGPYSYVWSNGSTASNIINVAAGSYTVTATDTRGCTATTAATITQPIMLTAAFSLQNVTCFGGTNGSASVSAFGGNGGYTYQWSGTAATGTSASNLPAGTYSVTVTDNRGCTASASVNVLQPPQIVLNTNSIASACTSATGSANVTASGGFGAFSYNWSNGINTNTINNITSGNYTVTVTDANSCSMTTNAFVPFINNFSASAGAVNNVSCFGGNNGTATVNLSGGQGPFTYNWSPAIAAGATAPALTAGNYSVNIVDNNGCVASANFVVTQPPLMALSASSVSSTCSNSNGSANVLAVGGSGGYTYLWSNAANTSTANNLIAGPYSVTVSDANGCTTTTSLTVSNISGPSLAISSVSQVNCNGGTNGSAVVAANGGTGPFTYSWSPIVSATPTASALAAGNYAATVTDANGCTASTAIVITQPTSISLSISTVASTCGNNNGSASVSAVGGTGAYSYNWTSGALSQNASALSAGNYSVTVTDANGCSSTTTANVTNIAGPILNLLSSSNVTCNGLANGTAVVNASNGTAPFSYAWTGGAGTGISASNLAAGNYIVTVTDNNGCTASTSIVISQPAALNLTSSTVSSTCGNANGSASIVAIGGTGAYNYLWSNMGASAGISNISSGAYAVTVIDANGCTANTSLTITNIDGPTLNIANTTNATCNGTATGSALLNTTGGTGVLTYTWAPSVSSSNSSNSLVAGNYSVTVADQNGCSANTSFIISEPSALSLVTSNVSESCNNQNGSASVVASGGTGAYNYSWSSGGNGATANNLSAGTYNITVTDMAGCSTSSSVTLNNISGPTISVTSTQDASCFGFSDGAAIVNSTGGTSPINFLWSNGGFTGTNANNLVAGSYVVTATDANGCISTTTAMVNQPPAITLTTSTASTTCGMANGSALAIAVGGNGSYSYTWSTGVQSNSISNVPAGNYSVTVVDALGCASNTSLLISNLSGPTININSISNVSCNGGANGGSSVYASSGTSPFTYQWSNGTAGSAITGVPAGGYTVTVTDASGCSSQLQLNVTQPAALASTVTAADITCNGLTNGSATVQVSGGTSPYSYSWSNGANGASVSNLPAGNYSLTITDINGCAANSNLAIIQPSPLIASATGSTTLCPGQTASITASATGGTGNYTYVWSNGGLGSTINVSPNAVTNYIVTVTDANGCQSAAPQVAVGVYPALSLTTSGGGNICAGQSVNISAIANGGNGAPYNYSWSNGATTSSIVVSPNLSSNYMVTVTDGCNLQTQSSVPVQVFASPTSLFTPSSTSACGSLDVTYNNQSTGGITYQWNLGDGTTSFDSNPSHTYTIPGSYTVTLTVSNSNGCSTTQTLANVVQVYPMPEAKFTYSPSGELSTINSTVSFLDLSALATSWSWDFGDNKGTSIDQHPKHNYENYGKYKVRLAVSSINGCVDTTYRNIVVEEEFALYVPNSFTPDDNGLNDYFYAYGIGIHQFNMTIFDRWGNVVYTADAINKPWGGKEMESGKDCPIDVYVYLIRAKDATGTLHEYRGKINLVR